MKTVAEIVAKISGKPPEQVSPEISLRSLGITSSIQILKIRSALERQYSQKLPVIADSWTVARIAAQVGEVDTKLVPAALNTARDAVENTESDRSTQIATTGISIGVDIEEIANLPATSNYRTDDFYQSQFSNEEISYALLKPNPIVHLCGIFCAKEALKKSAPELINLRLDEILVTHDRGRPIVKTTDRLFNSLFNFQVSISHTKNYAVATVISIKR